MNLPPILKVFLNKSSFRQRKTLTKEQVATLMHFCYCNARDLYDEAIILRDNKKYARAVTLCVLALEELSKMPIAINAVFFPKDDKLVWEGFWITFNSHSYKQRALKDYGKQSLMKVIDPKRWERYYSAHIPDDMPLNEIKLASIYVDCYDATAIRPNAIFTENKGVLPLIFTVLKNRLEAWAQFHSTHKLSSEFVESTIDPDGLSFEKEELDVILNEFRSRARSKKK